MRKIFIILSLLFSLQAFSQSDTTKYYKSFDYGWKHKRAQYDSALTVPKDTVNKNQASIAYKSGSFFGKDQYGYKPFVLQGSPVGDYVQNQSISAQSASMWINARGHYGGRLTLDSALLLGNLATDPAGVNGLTYYNTTTNKFRLYVNGAWVDLLSGTNAILNQTGSHQTGSFDITGTAAIQGGATIGTTGVSSNTSINMGSNGIFTITQTNGGIIVNNVITASIVGPSQTWERGTNTQGRLAIQSHTANNNYPSTLGTVTGYSFGTMSYATTGTVGTWTGGSFGSAWLFDVQTSANNPNAVMLQFSNGNVPAIFKKDGTTVLQKLTQTQPAATTAAATTTIDLSTGNIFQVNIGVNITTLTLNNASVGRYYIKFTQDATGGRTITWPANFKWQGGTAPSSLSGANKTDIIFLLYDGTNFYAIANLNY